MADLGIQFLKSTLRSRAFVALLDQAAVSIASFGTGILLSRAFAGAAREQLGLYYLAFTIGIFIVEIQNALVCTPLTVIAPKLSADDRRRFNGSATVHQLALSAVMAMVLFILALLAPALSIASHQAMLLACAVTCVAVGLRNFARYLNFSLHRPHIACIADWIVTILQLFGIVMLVHLHRVSAGSAVFVIGVASLIGGILALALSRRFIQIHAARAWSDFRNNWRLSRWVFASGIVGNVGVSAYPWVLDAVSSTLQAAVWGNCNTVSSVGNPMLMGLQNWMAPAVAHAYTDRSRGQFRNYVCKLASVFLLIFFPMLAVLGALSQPLLHKLYHDQTPGTLWLVFVLAAESFVQSSGFIFSRGLFSLGRGDLDTGTNVLPLVVLAVGGFWMCHVYGAIGGAWALLIAQIITTAVRAVIFWWVCAEPREQRAISRAAELAPLAAEAM